MTYFRKVWVESLLPQNRHFYVPSFQVWIEGENLPKNVLRDVLELKYIDSLTEIDRFEITVNNWEPESGKFKFIGSEPTQSEGDVQTPFYRLFQPCEKEVRIKFGYADNLRTMMVGNFTSMEPHFPANGAPTLTVTGLNVLHKLRRKQYTTAWYGRKPSWIARNIGTLQDGKKPRFPVPMEVVPKRYEPVLRYEAQTNQYDVDFLLNLGRRHGYEFVVGQDNDRNEKLYFRPGEMARTPINYRLDWGSTLIDFSPTITSHNQVKSVTVNGWDRQTQKAIRETVTFEDDELGGLNRDLGEFIQCDPREEIVVDRPVSTREEARSWALNLMRDKAASAVKASGTTVGIPDLRAGTKVWIGKLGARLSGEYLVTKTEHSLTDAGYTVRFEARREHYPGSDS